MDTTVVYNTLPLYLPSVTKLKALAYSHTHNYSTCVRVLNTVLENKLNDTLITCNYICAMLSVSCATERTLEACCVPK